MTQAGRFSLFLVLGLLLLEALLFGAMALYHKEDFYLAAGRSGPDFLFDRQSAPTTSVLQIIEQKKEDKVDMAAIIFTDEEKTYLQLVNKEHPVDANYVPTDLAPIRYFAEDRSADTRYLQQAAADQFHLMVEAAARKKLTIKMTTAYRSFGFQKILWENYVAGKGEPAANTFSAKPGESEHQTGLAVDITSASVNNELSDKFGETPEGKWLAENAHLFGFIQRYPRGSDEITGYQYEPWHYRYVGIKAAAAMYRRGLTLEEFSAEVLYPATQ